MRNNALNRFVDRKTKAEKVVAKANSEKNFKVILDKDVSLCYETRRWLYLLSLPLIWILTIWVILKKAMLSIIGIKPKINTIWVDGLSLPVRRIKEGSASWRALDIIYNFQFGRQNGNGSKIDDYWLGMTNAQAVRNRLRLVKRELVKAIREFAQKKEEVRLLSIASGSAQAIIEAIIEVKKEMIEVNAVFLDLDPTAIDYSRKLAKKYGLEDKINFVRGSTINLDKAIDGFRPNIVEMIGFLDYRPHPKAVHLVRKIHNFLLPGGKLLTANICPNFDQYFMKWVINWPMIYRKPEELGRIVTEGGFDPESCKIVCEPLKLHALAICQKNLFDS